MRGLLRFFVVVTVLCRTVIAAEVVDDNGRVVSLPHDAKRIVSLSPDLTEILFSIGAGQALVGVVSGCDFPSQAKKIPIVASYNKLDAEAILALHPDIIVSWTDASFSKQLSELHIPVYFSHPKKISDIAHTMEQLGKLVGNEKQANLAAQSFLHHYQELQQKYKNKSTLSVFYQVWSKPLITITDQSWINEVIKACGGKNIFSHLKGAAPEVNIEAVFAANPDVILGSDTKSWKDWSQLAAVQSHQVLSINTDLVERAGPRILDGVENVCRELDRVRTK